MLAFWYVDGELRPREDHGRYFQRVADTKPIALYSPSRLSASYKIETLESHQIRDCASGRVVLYLPAGQRPSDEDRRAVDRAISSLVRAGPNVPPWFMQPGSPRAEMLDAARETLGPFEQLRLHDVIKSTVGAGVEELKRIAENAESEATMASPGDWRVAGPLHRFARAARHLVELEAAERIPGRGAWVALSAVNSEEVNRWNGGTATRFAGIATRPCRRRCGKRSAASSRSSTGTIIVDRLAQ